MTSCAAPSTEPEPEPIRACTICRDLQSFDLLVEDMEAGLGDAWGALTLDDATRFLAGADSDGLDFVVLALDERDEEEAGAIAALIRTAYARGVAVFVVADEVGPVVMHDLLEAGAAACIPYPLPEGALHRAVRQLRAPAPARRETAELPEAAGPAPAAPRIESRGDGEALILPVHGLAGGAGATTFAVNLAWELATGAREEAPRVCLIDLDLQMGAVSTYLDLAQRDAVLELLTNTDSMDSDSFLQALVPFRDRLHVLPAPSEMLPLDLVGPAEIGRILDTAAANFDVVVIDMPSTVVQWTDTVLTRAHVYFAVLERDMRSAQNALRLLRALRAEDLPVEKLSFVLNRAPGFADLAGKSRARRLAESLDIAIEARLPDGGGAVTEANDQGSPLAEAAAKNPLRKEIRKIAAATLAQARATVVAPRKSA